MNSNTTRVIAGIAVVAVAVVLLIVLKDDGKSASESSDSANNAPAKSEQAPTSGKKSESKPAVPTIVIRNGKPVGGVMELTYDAGGQIRFKVDSDVSEEIHVHGYDVMKEVEAGGSVSFDIPADIEGVFEAEMEGQGVQIAEITVNP